MSQPPYMISVDEARNLLRSQLRPLQAVTGSLLGSSGRVLAESVFSKIDVPPFDNSAMDGYALAYEKGRNTYRLAGEQKAGEPGRQSVEKGEAVRIFTGALLPGGCDTVVQQEWVQRDKSQIQIPEDRIRTGMNVRYRGSQNKCGDLVAEAGDLLSPGLVGLIASVGVDQISVYSTPKVGILVTGDELIPAGEILGPGQIYNSNLPTLLSFLEQLNIPTYQHQTVGDDPAQVKNALAQFLRDRDVILISGGISVGEYDFVHDALTGLGVETLFYKVRQKPGKPFYAGKYQNKWVFALPGNPSSVICCFNQYIKPALLSLMGHKNAFEPDGEAALTHPWQKKAGLTHFLKGHWDKGKVRILDGQESFNLLAFQKANCFVEIPEACISLDEGAPVQIRFW